MMPTANLSNCTDCGKLFVKQMRPFCPDCHQERQESLQKVYRRLHDMEKRGGISVEDLARITKVDEKRIETFFLEGQLGMAAEWLLFTCANCRKEFPYTQRNGRHCTSCSHEFSKEANVGIRTRRELEVEQVLDQRRHDLIRQTMATNNQQRLGGPSTRFGRRD